jgi:hypothetical protein
MITALRAAYAFAKLGNAAMKWYREYQERARARADVAAEINQRENKLREKIKRSMDQPRADIDTDAILRDGKF